MIEPGRGCTHVGECSAHSVGPPGNNQESSPAQLHTAPTHPINTTATSTSTTHQRFPARHSSMSCSVGGPRPSAATPRSSEYMLITNPGVQKPHWLPWLLARAACTGCRPLRTLPMPACVCVQMYVCNMRGSAEEGKDRTSRATCRQLQTPSMLCCLCVSVHWPRLSHFHPAARSCVSSACPPLHTTNTPSTVTTWQPSTAYIGHRHALTALCCTLPLSACQLDTMTVQAPQPPSPQPSFVPVRPCSVLFVVCEVVCSNSKKAQGLWNWFFAVQTAAAVGCVCSSVRWTP